jgi:hypothetical protein
MRDVIEGLKIEEASREVLLEEIGGLVASLSDPAARARYRDLGEAVAVGMVSGGAIVTLEGLLEMLLQTGRARWRHGPESERDLLRLFHRTPGGSAARQATEAVNQAVQELNGQALQNMVFTPHGPGVFKLGIQTDHCKLALVIDSHGVSVESLEV